MALIGGCCFLPVEGQEGPLSRSYYPEYLRDDLAVIRQSLEQAHPDPYRYATRPEVDALFSAVGEGITGPLTAEGFMAAVMPVFRAVGDATTELGPPAAVADAYEHTEPLIPFNVAVIDGRLYLDQELKGFRSLPSGCELLAINDRPAAEVLSQMRTGLVTDGRDTTLADRRIERDFPVLYRRFVGGGERFTVTYRTVDGTTDAKDVFALTKDQMRQTAQPRGHNLAPWRLEEIPEARTAWLTLSTLDADELGRRRIVPERFLNQVLEALRKGGETSLVIDVRGAGGQDLGMAEQVFGLIAKKPYRVVKAMSVRSGQAPDSYKYAEPLPEFFASVGSTYLPESQGRRLLRADDPRLQPVLPLEKAFQGKVYVAANGATTGAGAAFVMMANRSGRARTVGEEIGSNAESFCGGARLTVTLPNTGCILQVPMTRYVPDGVATGPTDRGEMPASPVPQRAEDLAKGKDSVRGALLYLIGEMP